MKKYCGDTARNTSIADYVWLPLIFEEPSDEHPNGMVYIDWVDEWKIEDYEWLKHEKEADVCSLFSILRSFKSIFISSEALKQQFRNKHVIA